MYDYKDYENLKMIYVRKSENIFFKEDPVIYSRVYYVMKYVLAAAVKLVYFYNLI